MRRLWAAIAMAWCSAAVLHGQAAVEYAARSGSSALGSAGGGTARIGTCAVDSKVLSCLSHTYPTATIVVVVLLCILLLFKLGGSGRQAY